MYPLLLLLLGYRSPLQGVLMAVGITVSLLVHEFGHALVARHLRHDPSIILQAFGGLTSRSRTGRDVEEAAIVAMGPAAGLLLGLVVFGAYQLFVTLTDVDSAVLSVFVYWILYPCVAWNLLNLLPIWPLDGGQLFRLGTGRWLGPARAIRITHVLAVVLIVPLTIYAYMHGSFFVLFILVMLAFQNIQGLQGQAASPIPSRTSPIAVELIDAATAALRDGNYKEAARLAHQARAQEGVSPTVMERIWETLGVATEKAGEYEEALAYLKRARPNAAVRAATEDALSKLGRQDELAEFQSRWSGTKASGNIARWLVGALSFIVLALALSSRLRSLTTSSMSGASDEARAERELLALRAAWERERAYVREQVRQERLRWSLAERVERGLALRDLVVDDSEASSGDRMLLWVRASDARPFEDVRLSPGEPVRLWSKDPEGPARESAVVARIERARLGLMVSVDYGEFLDDGVFALDREAPEQSFERGARAISAPSRPSPSRARRAGGRCCSAAPSPKLPRPRRHQRRTSIAA